MRRALRSLPSLLALGLVACGAGTPPSVSPHEAVHISAMVAPWDARVSVAAGFEPKLGGASAVVLRGATLLLGNGKTIARGTLVLDKGKIVSVSEDDAPVPAGATVVDATGKFVTPGLVDTHSHIGVFPMLSAQGHEDGNEMTDPITPQAEAVDAFWPQDPAIERAVAGGVTTIQVLPGSGNLIGGRAVTMKLRPATSARAMHLEGALDGLKMACGENPKRVYGKDRRAPMTRMGNLALQRAAFLRARKLRDQWGRWREQETKRLEGDAKKRAAWEAKRDEAIQRDAWCKANGEPNPCEAWRRQWRETPLEEPAPSDALAPPDRDPGLETLVAAMEGRVLVHVHCYRADDMMAMLALSDEVGFKVKSFHHANEAYKIRDELVARKIALSTWADWWGYKMEAYDAIPENAALFHEAGGRTVIHSDSSEGIQRLNQEAAKALASGLGASVKLTEEDALRWVTENPAWALGLQDRIGTLEAGKDADVVLWSRNPLSVYAIAERVWIDGQPVFERGKPRRSDFEVGQSPSFPLPPSAPALLEGVP